jgi:hypothetical protein
VRGVAVAGASTDVAARGRATLRLNVHTIAAPPMMTPPSARVVSDQKSNGKS